MKLFFKVLPLLLAQSVFGATVNKIYPQWAVSNSTFNFTIEGTGFGNGTTFDFGGVDCNNASRVSSSSTKITYKVTCYPSTAGKIALLRINHNGTQVGSSSFQFFAGNPIVSDISVNGILNAGNTVSFDITGSYLPKTLAFAFTDCNDPQASGGISSSQRTFTCTYWGTAKQGTAEVKTDKQDNGGYVIKPKTFSTNQTVQPSPPISQDNERPYVSGLSMVSSLALGKKSQLQGTVTDNQGLDYVQIIVDDPDNITTGNHSFSRSGSKIFDLSNFTFDPTSYTGQKTGKYRITVGGRDLSGNQAINYTLDVNVYKEVVNNNPNQAEIDSLNIKLSDLNNSKASLYGQYQTKASEKTTLANDLNKKKTDFINASAEKESADSINTAPSFDIIANDSPIDGNGCIYLKNERTTTCTILSGFGNTQVIKIKYGELLDSNYPAYIHGESSYLDIPSFCTQNDLSFGQGATSTCTMKTPRYFSTPTYIAGNAKHLQYLIDLFNKGQSAWRYGTDNQFNDKISTFATAKKVSEFSIFDVKNLRDSLEESAAITLDEYDFDEEKALYAIALIGETAVYFVPVIGNGIALVDTVRAQTLITKTELSGVDRAVNVVFIILPQLKTAKVAEKLTVMGIKDAKAVMRATLETNKVRGALAADKVAIDWCKNKGLKCVGDGTREQYVTSDRRVDMIDKGKKTYVESKLGKVSCSGFSGKQLQKDIDFLIANKGYKIYWVISPSKKTGDTIAPKCLNMIKDAGLEGKIIFEKYSTEAI